MISSGDSSWNKCIIRHKHVPSWGRLAIWGGMVPTNLLPDKSILTASLVKKEMVETSNPS
jgi:hypothetical protein